MNENQISRDWKFWLRWVLFSTIGYGIGGMVGYSMAVYLAIDSRLGYLIGPLPLFTIGGALAGLSVGLAQWQAVRLKAPYASKLMWMAGNMIGMGISWTIFQWLMITYAYLETSPYVFLFTGLFWGVLSSIIQRHALQGQFQHIVLWFALNSLCGLLVLGVGLIWIPSLYFGYMSNSGSDIYGLLYISIFCSIIFWPLAGLLYGLVSGTLLTWFLHGPSQADGNKYVLAK